MAWTTSGEASTKPWCPVLPMHETHRCNFCPPLRDCYNHNSTWEPIPMTNFIGHVTLEHVFPEPANNAEFETQWMLVLNGSEYSYWRTAEEALKFARKQAKRARGAGSL